MSEGLLTQEQINELVDRFYVRLTQDSYYTKMFTERNVDLNNLKEQQKAFIARLANAEPLKEHHGEVSQVQERHQFIVNPERGRAWIDLMKETMKEMGLEKEVRIPLLEKMQFLLDKMLEKSAK